VMGSAGSLAQAQTQVKWIGTTGSYITPTNWDSGVTPSNAANEFLQINNNGTAQVGGADAAQGAFLNLGLQSGDTGHLEISGGSMTLGELRVGGRDDSTGATPGTNLGG